MSEIFFWKGWNFRERVILFGCFSGLLCLIMAVFVVDFNQVSWLYDWNVTAFLNKIPEEVYSKHSNLIESSVNTDVLVLLQKVHGTFSSLSSIYTVVWSLAVYFLLAVCVSVFTFLNRFWFIVCAGLLILLMTFSGVGNVALFGLSSQVIISSISIILISLAYYCHEVRTTVSFYRRLLLFCAVFFLIGTVIHVFSIHESALLEVAYQSYWLGIILSAVFSLYVGHEIVYAILVVSTGTASEGVSKGNGLHFIVFSLLYLLNVALVFMRNSNYIDWDIYYFNPYLLLGLSSVLGVWGLRDREGLYHRVMPFRPLALVVYLSMAVVTFGTILYLMIQSNDPALEAIEDAIVFGHIGMGGLFFIYILINFITLLLKGLPIYRVAFKEDNFPYATSKLAGVIVVAAFFFASNYAPFNQAVSGYFNTVADFNLTQGDRDAAKEYYRRGAIYGNILAQSNTNHRSNYMYAQLLEKDEQKMVWMESATKKNPTEQSYASLGVLYEQSSLFFDAVFTYQAGLEQFPDSWALNNNLGLLYERIQLSDSADYYLNQNTNAVFWQKDVLSANKLAFWALSPERKSQGMLQKSGRLDHQANWMANQVGRDSVDASMGLIEEMSLQLNLFSYAYLKNLGLVCAKNRATDFLSVIDPFLEYSGNDAFRNELSVTKAMNLYATGDVSNAFVLMNDTFEKSSQALPDVKMLLGKWSMELNAPRLAARYFESAREYAYPLATADLAQAYAMIGQRSVAQYLVGKELNELDSSKASLRSQLEVLVESLDKEPIVWNHNTEVFEQGEDLLKHAAEAQNKGLVEDATILYGRLGVNNPFFEKGVLQAAKFFNQKGNDKDRAYEILRQSIGVNEYSPELIMAYIDQCLSMGLISYAEGTVIRLIDVLDAEAYQRYELDFEARKSQVESELNSWD